jgi:DNA-binding HxlR family transcriptional regulator
MQSINLKQDTGCINNALAVLGDKWTPLLVRELTRCPQTFSDLETSLIGISPRTLSQRLNMLVGEGIVHKDLYCMHPPRYNYALTQKGQDLQSILKDMANWSEKYQ